MAWFTLAKMALSLMGFPTPGLTSRLLELTLGNAGWQQRTRSSCRTVMPPPESARTMWNETKFTKLTGCLLPHRAGTLRQRVFNGRQLSAVSNFGGWSRSSIPASSPTWSRRSCADNPSSGCMAIPMTASARRACVQRAEIRQEQYRGEPAVRPWAGHRTGVSLREIDRVPASLDIVS